MAKAKVLNNEQYQRVKAIVEEDSAYVKRDLLVLALSFRAGLRVAEIAGLRWRDVTDAFGALREDAFSVPNPIAKKESGREIAMHPDVFNALQAIRTPLGRGAAPVVIAPTGEAYLPNTLQKYMGRLYRSCGLDGVSSHSGRRTFITTLAQRANEYGCSLYDVQRQAGHANINTTAEYIDNSARVKQLVGSL